MEYRRTSMSAYSTTLPRRFSAAVGLFALCIAFLATGCDSSGMTEEDQLEAPDTYTFMRNGESSVSYSGQTDRLNMVAEMKTYIGEGDAGNAISEDVLLAMFTNEGGNGGGNFSFTSDRQLADKTFAPDRDANLFEDIFADAAAASQNGANGVTATDGTAGLLERADGGTILVDENGREFAQLVEKGLMGAVFYNQIYNVYLTDDRIGPGVENDELEDGANYTAMEHHWDEAFGYFAAPVDFSSDWSEDEDGDLRFWANYSNTVDQQLDGTNDTVMDAYINGRTAIVNDNADAKNAARDVLYEELELVAAGTTVHYINSTLSSLDAGEQGEAFHALSEAWAFANALKYSPRRTLSLDEIETIKEENFGANGNFWNVTPAGLNAAKATLVDAFPELAPVQDAI
jgi:hypothetical protein